MKFSLMGPPGVVKLTISHTASDNNFVKMTLFQLIKGVESCQSDWLMALEPPKTMNEVI